MKKIILISSAILLLMNILFGAILSCYHWFNVMTSSVIIAITTAILFAIHHFSLKDGFKASLTMLFSIAGLIEFVIALFMPSHFADNWGLIAIVFILVLQVLLFIIVKEISVRIK